MEKKHPKLVLFVLMFFIITISQPISSLDFVFNGFNNSTDVLLYGIADIDSSNILTLTNETDFVVGRGLYSSKIPTKSPNSSHVLPFSTSFIFSMTPSSNKETLPGHGIVFIFTPSPGIDGTTSSQHLGLFNLTNDGDSDNHVFGVEFDVFLNQEFEDMDDNHVGIDVNSLKSTSSHTAGYWPDNGDQGFEELKLNSGENYQKKARERAAMEDWEFEYWPHKMTYREIDAATDGFSDENVIGFGGNGKVHKGVLQGGTEIAVKRISHENDGMREFLAEVSSLGRLKHRSLVSLKGWCKKEKGTFMLVYDYMENGSLDKRIYYDCDETKMLNYNDRIRIIKDVASAILYLHEGWEAKVLHRDIKASNVLLDKYMNGRLGDFGLARMHGHGQVASTTRVVGTVGYLAPEVFRCQRASTRTDVFSFGILILEVMCGRRPVEEGKPGLVNWVWELMMQNQLLAAVDPRLRTNDEEVEKVLHLGLLCSYPDPNSRPTMRQVVKVLEGKNERCEAETEDMEAYLLHKVKTRDMWINYSRNFGYALHPTIDNIRRPHSSFMSLSWTNSIVEGR
uniref:non-specific serine/threonine protein kinase n=1 Tax=Gossypium raimondii TaxID=29730 RepID=A0A0D2UN87_GOSRA|nr:hypothetical protein B456_011G028100 [Gossypium raimondii]